MKSEKPMVCELIMFRGKGTYYTQCFMTSVLYYLIYGFSTIQVQPCKEMCLKHWNHTHKMGKNSKFEVVCVIIITSLFSQIKREEEENVKHTHECTHKSCVR